MRVISRVFASNALTTVGRHEEADALVRELRAIAETEGSPLMRWIGNAQGVRAEVTAGLLAEAHLVNDETLRRAQALGQADGEQWWAAVTVGLAWFEGTVGTMADAAASYVAQYPRSAVWPCAWAWLLAEAGRTKEAWAVIEDHALLSADLVDDPLPTVAVFQLAQAAFLLDHRALGARVVEVLAPYPHLWSHYSMLILGPNAWALGNAHAAAGDLDRAVARFDETLGLLERCGMAAHLPRARLQAAQALRRRGDAGDGARARELLVTARAEAEAVGVPAVVAMIDADLAAP